MSRISQTLLVIESKVLAELLKPENVEKFVEVSCQCPAIVCCRCSPTQKADVVAAIKKFKPGKITLAIGDGGNDVSMIREAHVGVGIFADMIDYST